MLLVVDAIQQLGAIRTELTFAGIDILMAGGHKWLNAPFGCGILYLSPRALSLMKPVFHGYLTLSDPEGGWGTYFSTPSIAAVRKPEAYHFVNTAKRHEIGGTSNYPGAIGLAASLRVANEIGAEAIERHVLALTDVLVEGLPSVGATLVTPTDRKYRSGIVSFRFYKNLNAERELVARLCRERVFVSIRFTAGIGGIRVSCHYFNTREHLEALFEALRGAAKEMRPDYAIG
jgi:selenocysteine lyase/cysteine desulfurase